MLYNRILLLAIAALGAKATVQKLPQTSISESTKGVNVPELSNPSRPVVAIQNRGSAMSSGTQAKKMESAILTDSTQKNDGSVAQKKVGDIMINISGRIIPNQPTKSIGSKLKQASAKAPQSKSRST